MVRPSKIMSQLPLKFPKMQAPSSYSRFLAQFFKQQNDEHALSRIDEETLHDEYGRQMGKLLKHDAAAYRRYMAEVGPIS